MSNSLDRHPGYLGFTSKGVVAIHADWPAYATEHEVAYALLALGQFPSDSVFTLLDDIDQCFLFVLGSYADREEAFGERRLHLALWHEDVWALTEAGYLIGARLVSHNEWPQGRARELKGLLWQQADGALEPVPPPELEDADDFGPSKRVVIDDAVSMTRSGHAALIEVLTADQTHIPEELLCRANPAIQAGLYDTAVRDACILLESCMREVMNTNDFGATLIDRFFTRVLDSEQHPSAHLKTLRVEVRSLFKFIRNDFAHNFRVLSEAQCSALLSRISFVYNDVSAIAHSLKNGA